MSRFYIGFLAAGLAASASALLAASATAEQQPTASAIDPNAAVEVAQSMDEAAFKQMLVKGSPWTVEWQNIGGSGRSGTYNIAFALSDGGATVTGKYYNSPRNPDGPLKEIAIKKNCLGLLLPHGTKYDYCLTGDGTLKGTYEGMTQSANRFTGEAVAKPAGR